MSFASLFDSEVIGSDVNCILGDLAFFLSLSFLAVFVFLAVVHKLIADAGRLLGVLFFLPFAFNSKSCKINYWESDKKMIISINCCATHSCHFGRIFIVVVFFLFWRTTLCVHIYHSNERTKMSFVGHIEG
jgi:hypothetical protein